VEVPDDPVTLKLLNLTCDPVIRTPSAIPAAFWKNSSEVYPDPKMAALLPETVMAEEHVSRYSPSKRMMLLEIVRGAVTVRLV
jgi:hypothetical protein